MKVGFGLTAQRPSKLPAHHHHARISPTRMLAPMVGQRSLADEHLPVARIPLHLFVVTVHGLSRREVDDLLAAFLGLAEAVRIQRFGEVAITKDHAVVVVDRYGPAGQRRSRVEFLRVALFEEGAGLEKSRATTHGCSAPILGRRFGGW